MIHTIEYRGKTITIEIDQDVTKFSYLEGSLTYKYDVFDIDTSKQLKAMTFEANETILVGSTIISGPTRQPKITFPTDQSPDQYNFFYNMVVSISQGQFRDRGDVNMVISNVLGEDAFPFNTYDQFALIQPVIYDLEVTGSDVEVTTVNTPLTGSIEYSIDNITYQSSPNFIGLSVGLYKMYVRNTETLLPYKKDFTIV